MVQVFYCQSCKHYWGDQNCEAFPGGIPQGIFRGQETHDEPTKEQKNKLVFTPVK